MKYFPYKSRHFIIITDRPAGERRKWRKELGWYPYTCSAHLGRDSKKAIGVAAWKDGGKACYWAVVKAVGAADFFSALENMQGRFPALYDYLEESEDAQQVFSAADLIRHPFLKWSFTHYALHAYCSIYGSTLSHHQWDARPVCTNNLVEQVNGTDKVLGIRYEHPLKWLELKMETNSRALEKLLLLLLGHPHKLTPPAHRVFEEAKLRMPRYAIRSYGQGGFVALTHVAAARCDGRDTTHVNVFTHTCDHPKCSRPVFTRETCSHEMRALRATGALDQPDFFEKRYPPCLLTASVLSLVNSAVAHRPPNLANMRKDQELNIRRAPAVTQQSPAKKGGPKKNNGIRFPSGGRFEFDDHN